MGETPRADRGFAILLLGCGRRGVRVIREPLNRNPESQPLPPTLCEDEALIAFDKPAGVQVSPDPHAPKAGPTLMDRVRASHGADVMNVHRLEREASGVLLCAKTKVALDFLSGQFQSKTADKRHVALVTLLPIERAMPAAAVLRAEDGGLRDEFVVDLPMVEDRREPGQMRVGKGAGSKDALSEFKVLERFGPFAWIECRPVSSRPHQLRVHLAAVGAPILNDRLYGDATVRLLLSDLKRGYKGRDNEKPLLTRLALHANRLGVKHPVSGEPLVIEAPLPEEFVIALKYLRKFAPATNRRQV